MWHVCFEQNQPTDRPIDQSTDNTFFFAVIIIIVCRWRRQRLLHFMSTKKRASHQIQLNFLCAYIFIMFIFVWPPRWQFPISHGNNGEESASMWKQIRLSFGRFINTLLIPCNGVTIMQSANNSYLFLLS